MADVSRRVRIVPIVVALVVVVAGAVTAFLVGKQRQRKETIVIVEPLQLAEVAEITRGIRDCLAEHARGVEVIVENVDGDTARLSQIVQKHSALGASVYVPIFQRAAIACKAHVTGKPIIFAAVADPVGASLLVDPSAPEGNVTGISDRWPVEDNLRQLREVYPGLNKVMVIYDPDAPRARATTEELKRAASSLGLAYVGASMRLTSIEDQALAQQRASAEAGVDVLFLVCDVGQYYDIGLRTGQMVLDVLAGSSVHELPVQYTTGGQLLMGGQTAEAEE